MNFTPFSHTARPTSDSAKESAVGDDWEALGALPEWDLTDLYPSMDSPELIADLERVEAECAAFAGRYEGKLAGLNMDVPWA